MLDCLIAKIYYLEAYYEYNFLNSPNLLGISLFLIYICYLVRFSI